MKTISLTQNQVTIVSDEDYPVLIGGAWYAVWDEKMQSYYAVRRVLCADGKRRMWSMHRQLLGLVYGDKRKGDHINGDTLDNRRENLRIASSGNNQQNQRKHRTGSSRYKGVHLHRRTGKWKAQISTPSGRKHLGLFSTEKQAHEAYCEAAVRYYGEFARFK